MIYLGLSIVASIGIFIVFKLAERFGINTRHAIMVNYFVASAVGLLLFMPQHLWFDASWFWPSSLLGVLFYVIFRVMARVTRENGLSVASIATKMSVVIPVLVGLVLLDESLNVLKVTGIILGLTSVILSAGDNFQRSTILWPIVLFIGSGIIDTCLKLFQEWSITPEIFPYFVFNVFIAAFVSALLHNFFTPTRVPGLSSIVGGVALGAVNFAALFFILKSLAMPGWESSVVFPINNFGIIAGSTLIAMSVFGERVGLRGKLALGAASFSIAILYYSR